MSLPPIAPAAAHCTDTPPSPWLLRWAQAAEPGRRALDLACGRGRHLRWLQQRGLRLTGVDRDAAALAALRAELPEAELIEADIEAGPWPLDGRVFDLVLVSNYLWRPLLPRLVDSLAPGGWLIYETFADGHQQIGRPSRPDFLLQHGELLRACAGLRIVAYEDGYEELQMAGLAAGVNARQVQRVAAVREATAADASAPAARYRL